MARKKSDVIGTMACLCCGEKIPVKQYETGTLNAACPWCELPTYAHAGTKAHKLLTARVTLTETPTPSPAPVPKKDDAPPPPPKAVKRANTIFGV